MISAFPGAIDSRSPIEAIPSDVARHTDFLLDCEDGVVAIPRTCAAARWWVRGRGDLGSSALLPVLSFGGFEELAKEGPIVVVAPIAGGRIFLHGPDRWRCLIDGKRVDFAGLMRFHSFLRKSVPAMGAVMAAMMPEARNLAALAVEWGADAVAEAYPDRTASIPGLGAAARDRAFRRSVEAALRSHPLDEDALRAAAAADPRAIEILRHDELLDFGLRVDCLRIAAAANPSAAHAVPLKILDLPTSLAISAAGGSAGILAFPQDSAVRAALFAVDPSKAAAYVLNAICDEEYKAEIDPGRVALAIPPLSKDEILAAFGPKSNPYSAVVLFGNLLGRKNTLGFLDEDIVLEALKSRLEFEGQSSSGIVGYLSMLPEELMTDRVADALLLTVPTSAGMLRRRGMLDDRRRELLFRSEILRRRIRREIPAIAVQEDLGRDPQEAEDLFFSAMAASTHPSATLLDPHAYAARHIAGALRARPGAISRLGDRVVEILSDSPMDEALLVLDAMASTAGRSLDLRRKMEAAAWQAAERRHELAWAFPIGFPSMDTDGGAKLRPATAKEASLDPFAVV